MTSPDTSSRRPTQARRPHTRTTATAIASKLRQEPSPATSRFLSRDPLSSPPTEPALSPYVYADDEPTVRVDPSGMGAMHADSVPSRTLDDLTASDLSLSTGNCTRYLNASVPRGIYTF